MHVSVFLVRVWFCLLYGSWFILCISVHTRFMGGPESFRPRFSRLVSQDHMFNTMDPQRTFCHVILIDSQSFQQRHGIPHIPILKEFGVTTVILTPGTCGRGPVLQMMTADPADPLRVPNHWLYKAKPCFFIENNCKHLVK